ncbi:hypothetical protein N825_10335 [Skermanella stibiiresistens SB22]|uniref:Uncharacterized protein n=1 Tax=Skermanella stibiiresistens SB22 TaxID=1385369 RepID=W9H2B8_9PROT|nr:hypothetical protein N825_10335 [Skermanella stibiiresistens SB22]
MIANLDGFRQRSRGMPAARLRMSDPAAPPLDHGPAMV